MSKKYDCNENVFDFIDSPEKAYWVGFITADGNVVLNKKGGKLDIALKTEDREHLLKLKKFLRTNIPLTTRIYPSRMEVDGRRWSGSIQNRIVVNRVKVAQGLIKNGVNELKVNRHPKISKELISHFIRGYFDGDGCITFDKTHNYKQLRVYIVSSNYYLMDWIVKNLPHGISQRKIRHYKNIYRIDFASLHAEEFLEFVYKDSTIKLDRKYRRWLSHKERSKLFKTNKPKARNNDHNLRSNY